LSLRIGYAIKTSGLAEKTNKNLNLVRKKASHPVNFK